MPNMKKSRNTILKYQIFLFATLSLAPISLFSVSLSLDIKAEAAILMNAKTGAILYEKKSKELCYPASITKIATALYALKLKGEKLEEILTAQQDDLATATSEAWQKSNYTLPAHWLTNGGTHIGLKVGEQMRLHDLLYGMMLASGNDASNVVARCAGEGSIAQFIKGLNSYLKQLGCLATTFYNPHGLFHPKHQTTAYDMALITREALKNPVFCKIVSTVRHTRPKTNKQEPSTFIQTNKLLKSGSLYYPKSIGVKTGHLSQAEKNTFVAAARDGERVLIAVLLKVKERSDIFNDAIRMFEAAFKQSIEVKVLLKKGLQSFKLDLEQGNQPITTYTSQDLTLNFYPAEEPAYKTYLYWDSLTLPIKKGQRVGELRVQGQEGVVLASTALFSEKEVTGTWFSWISAWFKHG
jgi:serine-type D-Ala-D-Ala carboxypeptidase (penicillin-binding protein 5/6)